MFIYVYINVYICIYMFTSIYIYMLDTKMVLKTHLFIKSISLSLQKLCQYNKNLTKHQTKINTAISTN